MPLIHGGRARAKGGGRRGSSSAGRPWHLTCRACLSRAADSGRQKVPIPLNSGLLLMSATTVTLFLVSRGGRCSTGPVRAEIVGERTGRVLAGSPTTADRFSTDGPAGRSQGIAAADLSRSAIGDGALWRTGAPWSSASTGFADGPRPLSRAGPAENSVVNQKYDVPPVRWAQRCAATHGWFGLWRVLLQCAGDLRITGAEGARRRRRHVEALVGAQSYRNWRWFRSSEAGLGRYGGALYGTRRLGSAGSVACSIGGGPH